MHVWLGYGALPTIALLKGGEENDADAPQHGNRFEAVTRSIKDCSA